jgi:hypothetical protein
MSPLILGLGVLFWKALALQAQSQPGGQQNGSPWGTLAVVLAVVAITRRNSAIGGWLLYFLGLPYIRAAATVVNVFTHLKPYSPAAWHDVTLYLLFLNSTIPGYLFLTGAAIAVTQLVRTGQWVWVERLKTILVFDAAAGVLAIVIDWFYFKADLRVSIPELIFASILWTYLSRSNRVERVFLTHDWSTRGVFAEPPSIK